MFYATRPYTNDSVQEINSWYNKSQYTLFVKITDQALSLSRKSKFMI